jgi:hypothetical protein
LAGAALGLMQSLTPYGAVASVVPLPNRDAELGRGVAALAWGALEIIGGLGGEGDGFAADWTVALAPVGVALNVGSAAVMAKGGADVLAGATSIWRAVGGKPKDAQRAVELGRGPRDIERIDGPRSPFRVFNGTRIRRRLSRARTQR